MKSPRTILLVILFLISVFSAISLRHFSFSSARNAQTEKLIVEPKATLRAEGHGGSTLKLHDGQTIPTEYTGRTELLSALQSNSTQPLTLAAGDFDGDGVDDLISGYATDNGGLITLHRGNVESLFPNNKNADEISPFFAEARVFAVSDKPEFICVGDFNNDGKQDVVTAERGADVLNFFKGDGKGSFQQAEQIALQGTVTALVAGDLNRKDNLTDLAVGVISEDGAKVLIFEGWDGALKNSEIEIIALPRTANALAVVSLEEDGFGDLAIAAGNELLIAEGRDRQLTLNKVSRHETTTVIKRHVFSENIVTLTKGNLTDNSTNEILALTESGSLYSIKSFESRLQAASSQNQLTKSGTQNKLIVTRLNTDTSLQGKQIIPARLSSGGATDDLILLDEAHRQIHVLSKKPPANVGGSDMLRISASFESNSEPVAVLNMRLNKDGLDDIVVLNKDSIAPSVSLTAPQAVFTVTSTGNGGDSNTADGICNDGTGACTLRAAIQQANASAGADEIRFNIPGTAPFTFAPNPIGISEPVETITIDATTQPGFTGTPIVEIDGTNVPVGFLDNGLNFTERFSAPVTNSSNSVVRGLVLNNHKSTGIRLNSNSVTNVRVEGCYIGTDVTGTLARPNGTSGGIVLGRTFHTIGGTTAAARNVISGNNGHGINLPGALITSVTITGNYIGTNAAGTADLGNTGDGIFATGNNVFTTVVGGTGASAGNVISGNGGSGINLNTSSGAAIDGNNIGTSADGNMDLGNDGRGVRLQGSIAGHIGGTATGARNIISGNGMDGIEINFGDTVFVQGNFIGTKADGTTLMVNDRHGIFLTNFTSDSLIGGNTVTPGTCDGPCNRVAFGNNGSGVSITNSNPSSLARTRSLRYSAVSPEGSPNGFENAVNGLLLFLAGDNDFGIDLNNDGRTPNDPGDGDTGPNRLQNHAVVNQASKQGNDLNVQGVLNSEPNKMYDIDFYLNRTNGNSSSTYIGSTSVTTNGNGDANYNQSFPITPQTGDKIFAVTTNRTTKDTSETSVLIPVQINLCTFNVSPLSFNLEPTVNIGLAVTIDTQPGCQWGATSNTAFIFNVSPTSGTGSGSVTFNVGVNQTGAVRQGTLTVAGQTVTVTQAACTFTVSPTSFNVSVLGIFAPVDVTTQPGCQWTGVSNSSFITGGRNDGNGSGTVFFTVQGNIGPNERMGTMTVAGQTVTVTQAPCTYTLSPSILTVNGLGGTRKVRIETQSTCQWSAEFSPSSMGTTVDSVGIGSSSIRVLFESNRGNTTRLGNVVFEGIGSISVLQTPVNNNTDFDGDKKTDTAAVRPLGSLTEPSLGNNAISSLIGNTWTISNSSDGSQRTELFGLAEDKVVPGDYNGDGKSDLAVFRPSDQTWYIARPTGVPAQNFDAIQFGLSTDKPVPADYDGDGRIDIAVFRPSDGTWWILRSTDGSITTIQWGLSGDKPVPGDYDGDGITDIAVWRSSDGIWYIINSGNGSVSFVHWGLSSDKPAMGDYDGDFKTDIAVFRPSDGTWFILRSNNNSLLAVNWGLGTDTLVPADYDGDLKTDIAVWRASEGNWYILQSSNGDVQIKQLGQNGDMPVPNALLPE